MLKILASIFGAFLALTNPSVSPQQILPPVHFLYITNTPQNGNNFFRLRHAVFDGGVELETIDTDTQIYDGSLALDSSGNPHFAWIKFNGGNFTTSYQSPAGLEQLNFNLPNRIALDLDVSDNPYLAVMTANSIYFTQKIAGSWTLPIQLFTLQPNEEFGNDLKAKVDSNGNFHIAFFTVGMAGNPCFVRYIIVSPSGSGIGNINSSSLQPCYSDIDIALDPSGSPYVISSLQNAITLYSPTLPFPPLSVSTSGSKPSLDWSNNFPALAYFNNQTISLNLGFEYGGQWYFLPLESGIFSDTAITPGFNIGFIKNGNQVKYISEIGNPSIAIESAPFIYDIEVAH